MIPTVQAGSHVQPNLLVKRSKNWCRGSLGPPLKTNWWSLFKPLKPFEKNAWTCGSPDPKLAKLIRFATQTKLQGILKIFVGVQIFYESKLTNHTSWCIVTPEAHHEIPIRITSSSDVPASHRAQASVVTAALELFEAPHLPGQTERRPSSVTHQVKSLNFCQRLKWESPRDWISRTLSSVTRIWMMGCHTDGYLVQCSLLRWVVSFAFFQKKTLGTLVNQPRDFRPGMGVS